MLYLFYFFVFLSPLEYIQEKIPKGPTGVNYANIMMLVLGVWWLIGRPALRRPVVMRTPLNKLLPIYAVMTYLGIAYTWLTLPGADSPFNVNSFAVSHYLQLINAILYFFIAANMIDTRRKIHHGLIALALSGPIVFRAFRGSLTAVSTWHYSDNLRISSPFVSVGSNELGAFFVYAAIFIGLYAFIQRKMVYRLFFLAVSSMYCYGILYSYSRATQLAFVAAIGLMAALRHRAILVLIVLAAVTSSVWLPVSVRDRWEMTETDNGKLESSAQSRKDFANLAWDLTLQSPIIGHGVGSYKMMNPIHMDTHNLYMRTLCETGLVGFSILMSIWGTIIMMGVKLWRRATSRFDRNYGFALIIATVALMIANIFGDRFTHLVLIAQYWVIVGFAARLYANMVGDETLAREDSFDAQFSDAPTPESAINGPVEPNKLANARQRPGISTLATAPQKFYLRPVVWLMRPLIPPAPRTLASGEVALPNPKRALHKQPALNIVGQSAKKPDIS